MKYVVITSINPPHDRLSNFVELGYKVVVGDNKTDSETWKQLPKDIVYLSLLDQREISPQLDDLIGRGTYARKNFGYLWAAQNGATIIWDTDDDTFVRQEVGDPLSYVDLNFRTSSPVNTVWNPFSYFAQNSKLWPRGYPLQLVFPEVIARELEIENDTFVLNPRIDILQMLVSGDPDVDAIYRLLVNPYSMNFPPSQKVVDIDFTSWSPGNTQATLWLNRLSFPFLYVPRWVSFRFCDILKMYIAQTSNYLSYGGFLMEQVRNEHDLMADFESEIPVYLLVVNLLKILSGCRGESLSMIYERLVMQSICEPREIEAAALFADEMYARINN